MREGSSPEGPRPCVALAKQGLGCAAVEHGPAAVRWWDAPVASENPCCRMRSERIQFAAFNRYAKAMRGNGMRRALARTTAHLGMADHRPRPRRARVRSRDLAAVAARGRSPRHRTHRHDRRRRGGAAGSNAANLMWSLFSCTKDHHRMGEMQQGQRRAAPGVRLPSDVPHLNLI